MRARRRSTLRPAPTPMTSAPAAPEFVRPVAVEAPVQIVIGGSPFAVMMATPRDLEDFAYGFALTEQIAGRAQEIRGVEVEGVEDGWRIKIALTGGTVAGASGARKGDERSHRLRPLRHRGFLADAFAPPSGSFTSPDRAERDRRGARGARNEAASQSTDPRRAWRGVVRAGRANCGCARGRRKAQCARQGDRGVDARRRRARQRIFSHHQPVLVRDGRQGGDFGAGTLVSVSAPTSLALERARRFGVSVIAVARRDGALWFESGRNDASGGLAA